MKDVITIEESGMTFGDFLVDDVFRIERSDVYKKIGQGIKTVEFICLQKNDKVCFVEAKKSSPRTDNEETFDAFVGELVEKFTHLFEVWMSIFVKRRSSDISRNFLEVDMKTVKFKFILVIHGHKEEWLPPIRNAMKRRLMPHNKIWGSDVVVLNEKSARDMNLIRQTEENDI